ncbi:zf-HC2 domain-containing protein [Streptomyces sp. NRRL WC-3742]|uniref:zf-HC2 domain-containing protein n=1 Tax=Streptomyces sp. NRRL WC-3742 TaxID=1463934 RepID=UPI00068B3FB0|nr:zf-HC2 domain-containing protein [Streptomyces sp. NRRL WC-3742]
MRCAQFRTALSARLDGEPTGLPEPRLDKHLARCPGCRTWQEEAERLRVRTAATAAGTADGPDERWTAGLLARLADEPAEEGREK